MRSLAVQLGVLALVLLAGSALAAPADKHVTLEADDGQGCLGEVKNDCFRVVNGTLDGIEQGTLVHILLENVGSNPHNIQVTEQANADENNVDTSNGDAINASDTVDPGETANLMFIVPGHAEGLYFWCDVGTHEAMGMWLETDVQEASDPESDGGDEDDEGSEEEQDEQDDEGSQQQADGDDGRADDDGDEGSLFIPAPGALVLVAAGGLIALLRRRDRR